MRGIGFRSLTEALDTTTAQGRLVFHMFGALAEFERSLIRERTQAGLPPLGAPAALEAGRRNSRTTISKPRRLCSPTPISAVTQIAHRLGVSPATLYRYIPAARTGQFLKHLRKNLSRLENQNDRKLDAECDGDRMMSGTRLTSKLIDRLPVRWLILFTAVLAVAIYIGIFFIAIPFTNVTVAALAKDRTSEVTFWGITLKIGESPLIVNCKSMSPITHRHTEPISFSGFRRLQENGQNR